MNLEKTRNIAIRLMREHGLSDYTFKWDKAVRRFGSCNGRTKTITLSRPMTKYEINEKRVINTILHEIAHGLDYKNRGYSNHDSEWKRVARSIGVDKSQFMKWVASCPSCEKDVYYARKTKVDKACGSCCKKHNNNKYTSKYKFNWELNPKVVKYK